MRDLYADSHSRNKHSERIGIAEKKQQYFDILDYQCNIFFFRKKQV